MQGVRLIPEFFLNRLQMQACCSPQRGFLCMANDSGPFQLPAQTQHLEAVSLPSTSHIRLVAGATTQLGGTITNAQSPFDSRGTWLDRSCVISSGAWQLGVLRFLLSSLASIRARCVLLPQAIIIQRSHIPQTRYVLENMLSLE